MRGSPTLVGFADAPSETRRLLEQVRVDGKRFVWVDEIVAKWTEELAQGKLTGSLVIGPKDEAIALLIVHDRAGFARNLWVYLVPEHRQGATLATVLDVHGRSNPDLPLIQVAGEVGLPSESETERVLGPLGFERVQRTDMTYPSDRALPAVRGPEPVGVRGLTTDDAEALSRLTARAYWDMPWERALFATQADPVEGARTEIGLLLGTEYGEWLSWASFGVPEGGGLAAAVMVNRYHGLLISNVMTDPEARGRGLASHLLRATIAAVRARETEPPRLAVSLRNERAFALYTRLGFDRDPEQTGSTWVRPSLVSAQGPIPPKL